MTTRLSNHIRGVLKTFGLLPIAMRGLPFDRKVEALLLGRSDVALIVRPMLVAWWQLREQIAAFDKAIRILVRSNCACRLLMSVPGIGVLSSLAYVSMVEDPARFNRSRSVGAHLGLTLRRHQSGDVDRSGRISRCGDTLARTLLYEAAVVILTRLKKASSLKDWRHAIARRSGNGKARVALARKLSVILHSVSRSAGRSTQTPPDSIVHQIHPSKIADVMVACRARVRVAARVGLERRHSTPARCGHCSTCVPRTGLLVSAAARSSAFLSHRRRNRTRASAFRPINRRNFASNKIDHRLGDVCGMIADPLDIPRAEEKMRAK